MNKPNYHLKMMKIAENISPDKKSSLLLHSCCAPCSSYCLEFLSKYFDIAILYYNPNIESRDEFEKRLNEQKRLTQEMKLSVDIITPAYDSLEFYDYIKGEEDAPEGGERCKRCYRLRMEKTAAIAKENGFDFFTTTLSISPLKNTFWINEIGEELATKYKINFLPSDFKKNNGYLRSIELSKIYNLYRQNFCGCIFSKK